MAAAVTEVLHAVLWMAVDAVAFFRGLLSSHARRWDQDIHSDSGSPSRC